MGGWAARHVPRVSCWAARHVPPRFLSSFFPQERRQAPPWRCGAGLTSELFRRARCEFFFLAPEASWGAPPWRCGAGFNSEFLLRPRCEFFFFIAADLITSPFVTEMRGSWDGCRQLIGGGRLAG